MADQTDATQVTASPTRNVDNQHKQSLNGEDEEVIKTIRPESWDTYSQNFVPDFEEEGARQRSASLPVSPNSSNHIPSSAPSCVPIDHGFHSIGQGYCPVSENFKMHNVFHRKGLMTNRVKVGETIFNIPDFVDMYLDGSTESWCMSQSSKESYETQRKLGYGFEKGVTLKVESAAHGKWTNVNRSTETSEAVLHEVRPAFLQVTNPDSNFSEELKRDLKALPISKTVEEKKLLSPEQREAHETFLENKYDAFFAKWGTHFVCKQWVGGYIKTDRTENSAKTFSDIFGFLKVSAKAPVAGGLKTDVSTTSKENLFQVKKGGKLSMSRHKHDDLMHLEFEKITPKHYNDWVDEVIKHPNALNYSVVLYPYYNSSHCEDQQREELRQRTLSHLAGGCGKHKGEEHCFHPSTIVHIWNSKQKKSIGHLNEFDSLCSVDKTSNITPSTFLTYLHKDRFQKAVFLVLKFTNEKLLKVTPSHLILVLGRDSDNVPIPKQAQYLQLGDRMVFCEDNDNGSILTPRLVSIETEEDFGVYCPLTSTGSFLANGFLVTCYASVDSFTVAHMVMTPLRLWYHLKYSIRVFNGGKFKDNNEGKKGDGVHDYAKFLQWFRSFL